MLDLLPVAFLGGLITGISPCIVPVLPVVVAGGSTATRRAQPFLIIAGLVVSFSLTELLGSIVLHALGLPQDLLYWLGIALLLILAVGLIVPVIGQWIERPFSRLGALRYASSMGGFGLGLSLGLVFVPCAGPVLAAISVAAANHRVNVSSLLVTLAYAIGATLPLLGFALLAQRAATGWQRLRAHLPVIRQVAGAVLGATTLAIAFGLLDPLQRVVPGYASSLETHVENGASISKQLSALSGERTDPLRPVSPNATIAPTSALPDLGRAPNFAGIDTWLNTPGDRPLTLAQLKGKVVLVDFWTYSCINCQRSLPHVESWYNDYKGVGFIVVGVHTPEFAFEHVVSNVRSAAKSLGVDYPIAIDNNYDTWDAYANQSWPADYLIDPSGEIRAYNYGEGAYSTMESNIRSLLRANGVTELPPRTDVPDRTPTEPITQEFYLGYDQLTNDVGTMVVPDQSVDYHAPVTIPSNSLAFNGTWTNHAEEATAGRNAQVRLHFSANDVYLVMGGSGAVDISFDGHPVRVVQVHGIPKNYQLFSASSLQSGQLTMSFAPGVQGYDLTFG